MSEPTTMNEENKKTVVAFIAGLLIGGLMVFIFANPADGESKKAVEKTEPNTTTQDEGTFVDGEVVQQSDDAGEVISSSNQSTAPISNVTFPADAGWVGIRDYEAGQLTGLLGVARWNKEEGLLPTAVPLLRPTVSGKTYGVVFYTDNGDKRFDLATDVQIDAELVTFVAE